MAQKVDGKVAKGKAVRSLSKSKLMASRQCPKRIWLEIHQPELREDSGATQHNFRVGNRVGEIARELYDMEGNGALVNAQEEGFDAAFARTCTLVSEGKTVFEGGFSAKGALAFADILMPVKRGRQNKWRLVEVKASSGVKDYHLDDVAIQSFVLRASGVPLASVALAHIDSDWVYPGKQRYQGLLKEVTMDAAVHQRDDEVEAWIRDANQVIARSSEPDVHTGAHCDTPYPCGFYDYCRSQEKQPRYPATVLPRMTQKIRDHLEQKGSEELKDVPDDLLSEQQLRVKQCTLSGKTYFDPKQCREALESGVFPLYFLDFETVAPAVPLWKGTRPFQAIPFQFSVHKLSASGSLTENSFLDLSGDDPRQSIAEALVAYCGERGTIYAYNAGFESRVLRELAAQLPRYSARLQAIAARLADLLPITRKHYYHPDMQGSWSIKAVLPTIAPDLDYSLLDGVQDGGMAMEAWEEAVSAQTSAARREEIRQQLTVYCQRDTLGLVKLHDFLRGGNP